MRCCRATPSVTAPELRIQNARPEVVTALGLKAGTPVVSREQERYVDGVPWSLQTSFYSSSLVDRGAIRLRKPDDIEEGTVRYLREALGIEQAGYYDQLRIRPATDNEEEFFKLRTGSQRSVLEHHRISYDAHGNPFRLTVTVYHPDLTKIAIYEGRVPAPVRTAPALTAPTADEQTKPEGPDRSG